MQTLYNVDIECDPNVVLYVSTNGNTKTSRMLVDETGSLTIDPGQDSGYITELYFYGRNIENRFLKDIVEVIYYERNDNHKNRNPEFELEVILK